jgi:hypothetical protein
LYCSNHLARQAKQHHQLQLILSKIKSSGQDVEGLDILRGNSVLLPAGAREPQGALLSISPDQTRSGGHMKAAGPISSSTTLEFVGTSSWPKAKDARPRRSMFLNIVE